MWRKDTEWAHSHLMYWYISTNSFSESCNVLLLWILFESLHFEVKQNLQTDITCISENFLTMQIVNLWIIWEHYVI